MNKTTALFFIILICNLPVLARNASMSDTLSLIPYPQQIKRLATDFRPDTKTTVVVCSSDKEDQFAASQLTEEFSKLYALNLKTAKSGGKNAIILTRPGLNKQADSHLKDAGLEFKSGFNTEGYVLLADDQGIVISATSASGLFYGVQTLRQLIHPDIEGCLVHGVNVRDWPAMAYRWQMDDWNRGPIPTIEYAKKQVKIMSEYKMNGYCIYAENIFESKEHPMINPYGGTITAAEIAELIAFAKPYHVDIIPQQESFGHLHYVLRQEQFAKLGEKHGSQILSPSEPEAIQFISDYLGEVVSMFQSPFVHIGCDEPFELGRGKSKELAEKSSIEDVYFEFLNKIAKVPALEGKRILFWGEIGSVKPEKLDQLPKGIIANGWDYLVRDYTPWIKPYADRNIPTFVSPAAFYGGRIFPDYKALMKNISQFVCAGQKLGSIGMMNTSWDDLGEDVFDMGWYGVIYGAACSWQVGESNENHYRNAFDWAFYRNANGHQFAEGINKLASIHTRLTPIDFNYIYSNPFTKLGIPTQNYLKPEISREMRLIAEDAFTLFKNQQPASKLHAETSDALMFAAKRMDFVFHKAIIANEMSKLYDAIVHDDDKGFFVNTALYDLVMPYASRMGDLRDMTKELKAFHKAAWDKENRPFHWDVIEARYLKMAIEWEQEGDRISTDLQQFGTSGKHLPREEVGFGFDRN